MIAPVPDFLMLGQAARPAAPFHWNLGDVATWVLALTALGALVAAILAYFKQADAARKLAEQVRLQSDALADQRQANAKQAEVLEAELAGLRQRAEALAWQQADAVTLEPSSWRGSVPGPRTGDGPVHMAVVTNGGAPPFSKHLWPPQPPPPPAK